eukprot:6200168-Pleurochrysis_carterae.AAC.6
MNNRRLKLAQQHLAARSDSMSNAFGLWRHERDGRLHVKPKVEKTIEAQEGIDDQVGVCCRERTSVGLKIGRVTSTLQLHGRAVEVGHGLRGGGRRGSSANLVRQHWLCAAGAVLARRGLIVNTAETSESFGECCTAATAAADAPSTPTTAAPNASPAAAPNATAN